MEITTESCVFHVNTHEANRQLDLRFTGTEIQHVEHLIYLGVTLDRTLTYNAHLTETSKKVSARINIVRKVAGTGWGAADTNEVTNHVTLFILLNCLCFHIICVNFELNKKI
jgi:hypothetical protein